MAHIHNLMIRAMNTIHHQAPHVHQPADIKDLLSYGYMTVNMIEHHHHAEEENLFPDVEEYSGKKGLMEGNKNQHHEFYPGLHAFRDYCQHTKLEDFKPDVLLQIMVDFAPIFRRHLTDEVQTLLELREYDSADLMRIWKKTEKHAADFASWVAQLYFELISHIDRFLQDEIFPLVLGLVDNTFEGGTHKFPPLPWFAPYVIHYWFGRKHAGAWRFNPSDMWGNPRPLLFVEN
jgi:hemerythrin-like domain-containing protein